MTKYLLIFLLLAVSVVGQSVNITNYVVDSSSSRNWGPLSIPRVHDIAFSQAGDIGIYMSTGFPTTSDNFYISKNLDSSVRWPVKVNFGVLNPYDHAHLSVYKDTVYWGKGKGDSNDDTTRALFWNGTTLTSLFKKDWALPVESLYINSVVRLPNSDTTFSLTRGYGSSNAQNIMYSISTDKGQTWGTRSYLANWPTVDQPRIVGIPYNNTVAAVACSAGASIIWWEWNRTTKVWTHKGRAINKTLFRGYSAATYKDTVRFVTATYDSYAGTDSVYWAYMNAGSSGWTGGAFKTSVNNSLAPGWSGLTYIENSQRLVLFYTMTFSSASIDSFDLYMKYWRPEIGNWSDSTRVSVGKAISSFDLFSTIPSSHGDVAYVTYRMDSTIGTTVYHYAMVAKIAFVSPVTHYITSLPDTIYQTDHIGAVGTIDTIELVGTKLTSGSNGLVLAGTYANPLNGWYIKLGTDTIEFATDSLGLDTAYNLDGSIRYIRSHSSAGLRIVGHVGSAAPIYSQNITIEGGTIICKAYNRDDSIVSYNNVCLNIGAEDVYVHNTKLIADGYNGKCLTGDGYDVEIDGGIYSSNVTYFLSRCQFDAIMVNFGGTFDPAVANIQPDPYTYNFKIHGVSMSGIPHMGIRYDGGSGTTYGICHIYNNTINVDSRNDLYLTESASSVCAGSGNAYGIGVQYVGPGSTIHDNTITSGTSYGGGRGLLFERIRGTTVNPVLVYNNSINVHEGPDAHYGEGLPCFGLRIRTGCYNMQVYDNTFIVTLDSSAATSSYGYQGTAVCYSWNAENSSNSNITIENNLFRTKSLTTYCVAYGAQFDEVLVADTTLTFRYNRIETDNIMVTFGEVNAGAKGITMTSDTLAFLSPTYSPQTFVVGYLNNNWMCQDNVILDAVYETGVSDTNIIMSTTTRDSLELFLKKTVSVKVVDLANNVLSGVTISGVNNYGQSIYSGTTNALGLFSKVVTYWYETSSLPDSTTYNDFTFTATYGGNHVDAVIPVAWQMLPDTTIGAFKFIIGTDEVVEAPLETPCVITQSVNVINIGPTSIKTQNTYSYDTDSTLTELKLIWDDDNNPALPLGTSFTFTNFTNPDTLTANGLDPNTQYWFWWILYNGDCSPDTSDVISATTLGTSSYRKLKGIKK